jgi:hypothetical protein
LATGSAEHKIHEASSGESDPEATLGLERLGSLAQKASGPTRHVKKHAIRDYVQSEDAWDRLGEDIQQLPYREAEGVYF